MSRAAAVPVITRLKVGMPGTVAPLVRAWGLGSVMAILMTLTLVLLAEGWPGDLDPTFGVGGKVTTDFGALDLTNALANALVLQPDGKLVAAGLGAGGAFKFTLARYRPDGSLDPTFGTGGQVTTDFGEFAAATALVLQPDGKLVAAGPSGPIGDFSDFALARYRPDGSLDLTFGTGGKVITDFGQDEQASALVLQPDGKLVAAGFTGVGAFGDFALARYLPDGSLDPTFGTGGQVTTDFGGGQDQDGASALVLQPDGKLVAAGSSTPGSILARYLPDGSLDPTFGTGGKVISGLAQSISALVLQSDGKLVGAGTDVGGSDFALARYLPDGSLDPTFGTGGTVRTDFGGFEDIAQALVLQPDGKLVAAGFSRIGDVLDFVLARYLPDGSLDPTFGTGGTVRTDFGGFEDIAQALVLQPDGKLVATGSARIGVGGTFDFALARYVEQQLVFNDFVSFEPLDSTFHFSPEPTECSEGFVGTFSFEARLTNISDGALSALVVAVTTLTNGNLLQNADGGPGGVGGQLTVPQQDGFTDGVLGPEEFVDVPFLICLTAQVPFTFVVDVFGDVDASANAAANAPLVQ